MIHCATVNRCNKIRIFNIYKYFIHQRFTVIIPRFNGCTILSIAAKIPVNEEAFTDVQMY